MKRSKLLLSLSMAGVLLTQQCAVLSHSVFAHSQSESATHSIKEHLLTVDDAKVYQVNKEDRVEDIAEAFELDAKFLTEISEQSEFPLSTEKNWLIYSEERYVILADEHFHEYEVYDIMKKDDGTFAYEKVEASEELLALIEKLHTAFGHQHDHSHDGHGHSHDGHDHSHDGHGHSHDGHDHSHDGHGHSHVGHEHEHNGHEHEHDEHGHSHVGHEHEHNGHEHEHNGHEHEHDGHEHEHNGHEHEHNGHEHEHDGHEHNHDGHSHDFTFDAKDIVSEDADGYVVRHGDHFHYVLKKDAPHITMPSKETSSEEEKENEEAKKDETEHTHSTKEEHSSSEESSEAPASSEVESTSTTDETPSAETKPTFSPEVEAKINYIVSAYGVLREAIKVTDEFFIFNEPGHEYDPTHVHPYVIPIALLEIPEVTGDPEIDFENELYAVAKRNNMSPFELRLEGDKFVIPHGDHDHFIKVKAIEGAKDYFANRLPEITSSYVEGDFKLADVEQKVADILKKATELYPNDAKKVNRIRRALERFTDNIKKLATNSTAGYIDALDKFQHTYVATEETPKDESTETAQDTQAFDTAYNALVAKIRDANMDNFNITKEDLLAKLNAASATKDLAAAQDLDAFVDELLYTQERPMISLLKYMDYLLSHLDHPAINNELREKIAETVVDTFIHRRVPKERPYLALIETRKAIEKAVKENVTAEEHVDSEFITIFKTLTDNPLTNRESIRSYISRQLNEMRDFLETYEDKYVPHMKDMLPVDELLPPKPKETEAEATATQPTTTPATSESAESSQENSSATTESNAETPTSNSQETSENQDATPTESPSSDSQPAESLPEESTADTPTNDETHTLTTPQ